MNIWKIKLHKLLLPLIYIYTIFPFATKSLPSLQFGLFYFIITLYVIIHYKETKALLFDILKSKNTLLLILLLYLSISFFALLSPCIHATEEIGYFLSIILGILRNFIKTFFLLIITYKFIPNKNSLFEYFLKYNIQGMIIYIFSTIIFIIFPNIKMLWRNIIYESSSSLSVIEQINYFTRYGLAGFSGFRQTSYCSICYIFNLININLYSKRKEGNYINWIIAIFLLMGNSFYGRSGLLVSLMVTVLYVIHDIVFNKNYKFICYISIALVSIFILLGLFRTNKVFDLWYRWSMAPINNIIDTGKIGTYSSDKMFEKMSFWPGWETFAFGDGYWNNPYGSGYYKHTDLGYMRPMLFYGVFPQILAYLIPLIILLKISIYGKIYRLLSILLTIQLILFELKGEIFYIQTGIFFCCLISITCKDDKKILLNK